MSYIVGTKKDSVEINQKRDIYNIYCDTLYQYLHLYKSIYPYIISINERNITWMDMRHIRNYCRYTPVIVTSVGPEFPIRRFHNYGIHIFEKNEIYIKYIPDLSRYPLSYNDWVKSGYKLILTLEEFQNLPESCDPQDFFQALDEGTRYYFNKTKFLTLSRGGHPLTPSSGNPDILFRFLN